MLQAASSNTLSSEDSLSVKSISVDGTPDHEQVEDPDCVRINNTLTIPVDEGN